MSIMYKLALRNILMNKSRTFASVVGIILSMALITIVANSMVSLKATEENYYEKHYGNYDISFTGKMTAENVKKLQANRNVSSVYLNQDIGEALFEDSKSGLRDRIIITAFSENAFGKVFDSSLSSGRYPKNSDEVVLTEEFVNYSNKKYKVGDTITLSVGKADDSHVDEQASDYEESMADGDNDKEEFVPVFTKSYKVCGILNREPLVYKHSAVNVYTYTDFTDKIQTAYDDIENYTNNVFIKLVDGGRKSSQEFMAELLDLDLLEFERNNSDVISDEEFYGKLSQSEFHILYAQINGDLYNNISMLQSLIFYVGMVLIILIMISGIFIIKNGFLISLTEKTVLYGKISGIGATPRQIRNSVFSEAVILGIAGIPVGLFIGIAGTSFVLKLSSGLLSDFLGGAELISDISWFSVFLAVILGSLTIFFSSLFAAVRAYRISPIEAIRSNKDIRIGKKEKNSFGSPSWVGKLFGAGGKIAWKNMKRSSKSYRTVVISIVVSISAFIAVSSFVDYTVYKNNNMYESHNYNMSARIRRFGTGSPDNLTLDEEEEIFLDIADSEGIKEYFYKFEGYQYYFNLPVDKIPKDLSDADRWSLFGDEDISENTVHDVPAYIVAYDDNTYNKILDRLGYSYDDMKDKAVIVNINKAYKYDETSPSGWKTYKTDRIIADPIGYKVNMHYNSNEEADIPPQGREITLEIGGEITDTSVFDDTVFAEGSNGTGEFAYGSFIVSIEWFRKNFFDKDNCYNGNSVDNYMCMLSEDPDKTEQSINISDDYLDVENYYAAEKQMNSVFLLVRILAYSFIGTIFLIGITNIFNTINTNTKLRQKEYAMLCSVGMTKREFNRMTVLECMFYTARALLIGIPTGLVGTIIIHFCYLSTWDAESTGKELEFMFPQAAVLISIVTVIALVILISAVSVRRIHNQNIVETIRNDNI